MSDFISGGSPKKHSFKTKAMWLVRFDHDLTLLDVSKQLNMSCAKICSIEQGREPLTKEVKEFYEKLGIDFDNETLTPHSGRVTCKLVPCSKCRGYALERQWCDKCSGAGWQVRRMVESE